MEQDGLSESNYVTIVGLLKVAAWKTHYNTETVALSILIGSFLVLAAATVDVFMAKVVVIKRSVVLIKQSLDPTWKADLFTSPHTHWGNWNETQHISICMQPSIASNHIAAVSGRFNYSFPQTSITLFINHESTPVKHANFHVEVAHPVRFQQQQRSCLPNVIETNLMCYLQLM